MSTEFDWQNAYRREHADFCQVEAKNYVLEKALREIVRVGSSNPDLMDGYALEGVIAIARKALGEE